MLIDVNVEATESNNAGKWILVVHLVLGIALLVIWTRRRFRPNSASAEVDVEIEEKARPGWQRRLNTMGYPGAFVTDGAVQTWPVMLAAGATILRLDVPAAQGLGRMIAFA